MTPPQENTGTLTATEVVLRYESLQDQGQPVTPESLCEQLGCPQLLAEVKQQIRNLRLIEQFLSCTTADYRTPAGPVSEALVGPELPCQIDQYEILHRLGQGGFGVVWRAEDKELGRAVAIKIPRPDRGFSQETISLFYKEARKAAALDHPNIVRVYHARRLGKTFFLVSQFIDGGTLAARMAAKPCSAEESACLVAQVAEALHHAHLQGLVHRDVKPGNILLGRDLKPYLTDFGLAATEEEQLKEPASILGTVAYMSPEQAAGGNNRVDARTDIYSLGVVLYELLTRRLPFVATNTQEYLEQIRHREPRPPRTIDDSLPPELERICLKCLAKSVADRYTTGADLAADLCRWLGRDSAAPPPVVPPIALVPTERRSLTWPRRLLLPTAGVLAALGLVLLVVWKPWDSPSNSRPEGKPEPGGGAAIPEPGVWHNLLDKEPTTLIHPKQVFLKQFDPGKSLFWNTMGDCLFRLGSAPTPDYEVEITVEQSRLIGHRGLFLGCRPLAQEGKQHSYECQAILLLGPGKGGRGAVLGRRILVFNDKTNRVHRLEPLGPDIPLPSLSPQKITLAVRVNQGRLAWVAVNQQEVKGLQPALLPGRPTPLVGDFGIFADQDNGWLKGAVWQLVKGDPS
ncbi:MAG: serine/threonine protein kinase [Gemmataceae bacterium]|nr:serine/threonine protein kinase [Gemmataceae bacterium]